ncbi:MAG: hypothetical protein IPM54_19645 [Polyangiaceae bacterium]|nr:hypothetical protein [Polyangiaceae bacterium]
MLAAQGVVHRDITPKSILVREADNAVFLVHFTSAGRTGDESLRTPNPDAPEGTLLYMALRTDWPDKPPRDHRADFYALGAVLYEMLTGSPPFTSQEPMALVHAHLARAPKPAARAGTKRASSDSRIVLKLLAKSADDRYQSARGIAADIGMCIERLRSSGRVDPFPPEDKTAPRCSPPPCVSTDATPSVKRCPPPWIALGAGVARCSRSKAPKAWARRRSSSTCSRERPPMMRTSLRKSQSPAALIRSDNPCPPRTWTALPGRHTCAGCRTSTFSKGTGIWRH